MPPVGQCQGRRNSADEGREGALSVGHLLGLQLPQEYVRTLGLEGLVRVELADDHAQVHPTAGGRGPTPAPATEPAQTEPPPTEPAQTEGSGS